MQIFPKSVRRDDSGFALIITMIFLAVALVIFGSMMYWVTSNAKVTLRNNQYNMSSGAAEAAVETVLAQMDRDFLKQSLSNDSHYPSQYYGTLSIPTTNWPTQYVFSDPNGGTNPVGVYLNPTAVFTNLTSQYTGLYGLEQDCTIVAKATPTLKSGVTPVSVPAIVREALQFASVPLFQFAIFYNINLEIAPGQSMTITGPVFSNAGIWAGASDTTFSSTVTAVESVVDTSANDPFSLNYSKDGGPTFTMAGQPSSRADPLIMPIGTNNDPTAVRAILNLPPTAYANGTAPAYTTNGQVYLANEADLIVSNSGTATTTPAGTNLFVFYQNPSGAPYLISVPPDYYTLKTGGATNSVSTNVIAGIDATTNVLYAGYTFVTNVLFYDWREGWNGGSGIGGKGIAVQAVQVDIGKYNTWLTNTAVTNNGYTLNSSNIGSKGHGIDSMYVYNSVNPTSTTLPAVRVINGQQLPSISGFTVATPFPMYVYGNYNSQTPAGSVLGQNVTGPDTYPAALMADAITVLSTNWNDSITTKMPTPGSTTINAAMLEGIVQTDPTISGDYSGGVENFMRLLEDWTKNIDGSGNKSTLTYNGSIVVMFASQYATSHWQPTGNYYDAPTRHWAFDQNFAQQNLLPPLTPQSKVVVRSRWLAQ